ncbi:hypothetical protein G7Y89_g8072 [Cudoniella acicularis]|uniref:Heterokaryon incompatibility domain-containing protein n=1 Tax=Cudoniella acicularis TaxID=354080 RepID=A0A8H4RJS4_9HELO|nr:hypothetical protein G7Y89_g8072 [Cudoniella acicularis]
MRSVSFLLSVSLPFVCYALLWDGPEQTQVPELGYTLVIAGWSLAPTLEPMGFMDAFMLWRRRSATGTASAASNASHATCGFVSGSTDKAVTCVNTNYICAQDLQHSVFGCCTTPACQLTTSCVPAASLSACGNDCAADPYVLKCVTASPYCNQYVLTTNGVMNTAYYCSNAPEIDTVLLTATDGAKGVATLVQVTEAISSKTTSSSSSSSSLSSDSSSSTSSSSIQSTVTVTPTPTPPPESSKPTPIGAIIGGTLGGVFVIGAFAILIIFLCRRNNSTPATAVAASTEPHQVNDIEDLCDRCYGMFSSLENLWRLASKDGYEHYNKPEMKASAKLGCPFCKQILRDSILDDDEPLEPLRFAARKHEFEDEAYDELEGFDKNWKYPFQDWKLWALGIGTKSLGYSKVKCVFVDPENAAAPFIEGRTTVTEVSGDLTISHARTWLEECHSSHPSCPKRVTPLLPTRVIDISGSKETGTVKLHIRQGLEHADYVALSYCWGGDQPGKTTTANIKSYTSSIFVAGMAQSIQDAIKYTEGMGLRYLWIDAFCIIQDSQEDKAIEIGAMGKIYKEATITFSAASSKSVHLGFLQKRDSFVPSYHFPFVLPNGEMSTVSLCSFDVVPYHREPLDSRAWCFQESMLAPRRLVFGSRELLWTCQTMAFKPIFESHILYFDDGQKLPTSIFDPSQPDSLTDLARTELWHIIVDDCTERAITVSSDRLPSITGVASELAKVWDDVNVIGLWKKSFARNLAWRAGRQPSYRAGETCRAPTWSWVATDGPVTFSDVGEMQAQLKEVSCKTFSAEGVCDSVHEDAISLEGPTLTIANLPEDFVEKRAFDMQVGTKEKLPGDTVLLLLGYSVLDPTAAPALVLLPVDNGKFKRVGMLDVSKGNGYIWDLVAVQKQTITII